MFFLTWVSLLMHLINLKCIGNLFHCYWEKTFIRFCLEYCIPESGNVKQIKTIFKRIEFRKIFITCNHNWIEFRIQSIWIALTIRWITILTFYTPIRNKRVSVYFFWRRKWINASLKTTRFARFNYIAWIRNVISHNQI